VSLLANTVTVYRLTKPLVNFISYPEPLAYKRYALSTFKIIAILLPIGLIWVDKWPDTKHQAIYRINTDFLFKALDKTIRSIRLGVILFFGTLTLIYIYVIY